MITIHVERNQSNGIDRIQVTGHANYAPHGQDLVCAAVSGITIGIVNAIEKMFGIQIHADDDRHGKIDCHLPRGMYDPETIDKIGLIMEAMYYSLKNVADHYPTNIKLKEHKK